MGGSAHAQSAGNAIENAELCRAAMKRSWTRPLGTTVGVPEGSAGDCRTGEWPLTGVNSEAFPGENPPPVSAAGAGGRRTFSFSLRLPLVSPAFGTASATPEMMLPLNA